MTFKKIIAIFTVTLASFFGVSAQENPADAVRGELPASSREDKQTADQSKSLSQTGKAASLETSIKNSPSETQSEAAKEEKSIVIETEIKVDSPKKNFFAKRAADFLISRRYKALAAESGSESSPLAEDAGAKNNEIFALSKSDYKNEFRAADEAVNRSGDAGKTNAAADKEQKFHWKPALLQSGIFLAFQHAFRMTEDKTRRELDGKFFKDYKESVAHLRGWDDGGKFFTNYIAHPMQGAATGRIFVNNSDRAKKLDFGLSRDYWTSRMKAMAWSAAWSAQFEIGPISEASLGNVGQEQNTTFSKMSYADLVLTPTLGTGLMIAEDFLDKYIMKDWVERKTKNAFVKNFLRIVLAPTTSFTNLLRGSAPWRRDNR